MTIHRYRWLNRSTVLMNVVLISVALVSAVLVSGCRGDGEVSQAVAEQHAEYRLLDLTNGSSSYRAQLADVHTNPAYRERLLVLRHMPPLTVTMGALPGEPFADEGEHRTHRAQLTERYVAVFELTRFQWQLIAGATTPWTALAVEGGDDSHPATGMSQSEAEFALMEWSAQHDVLVDLLSPDEWEAAARGAGGAFAFDPLQLSAVGLHARVHESLTNESGSSSGTAPVGQRVANAWGLFDIHGNAAELTAGRDPDALAVICGGSWNDPVATSRATNRVTLPPHVGHPLVGLRVVVHP